MVSRLLFSLFVLALAGCVGSTQACELCAIYNANSASGRSEGGFLFNISAQFIPYRTLQLDGREIDQHNPDYLDSAVTHFVPTYNFSDRFGLSLNVPYVYRNFRRSELRYSTSGPPGFLVEDDEEDGLGDIALVGRWTAWEKSGDRYNVLVNLMAGVKFPTGNTDRIRDEVEQTRIYDSLLPPGTPHDPLGHAISGVHQHDISPGSGSYDGIFGVTLNARWRRFFFNSQIQYYLRTEGESTYEAGDELMVSGGPGGYVLLEDEYTISLQAVAAYDTLARSQVLDRKSDRIGMTAWYFGPLVTFTLGERISANAGVDIPLSIANNGFQNVPDYRAHAGFSYRF